MDVTIGCPCPARDGKPRHETDTVTLREHLGFRDVTAIRHSASMVENDGSSMYTGELLAVLTEGYVLFGIESWSLTDEKDKPLLVSRAAIHERILSDVVIASIVADAADDLYGRQVLLPLLQRASSSSLPTPTASSTSRRKGYRRQHPTPSSPSSTITSPMAATATTTSSRAGVSS